MISVIITSWKEPNTIGRCIHNIGNKEFSGIPDDFEIIQVSPDKETLDAGEEVIKELGIEDRYVQIKDPKKGKPYALKMAFKKAKGDFLILTDGDTYFGENTVSELLRPFENDIVGGVSGKPVATNRKNTFMGYVGNLLVASADLRRTQMLEKTEDGYYISGKSFFPMSGYIMATRASVTDVHKEALSDDAYISYDLRNKGYEIAYNQEATAYVKMPESLKDYYKQKIRSLGGYIQLEKLGVIQKDKQSRSIFIEIPYTFFALFTYPTNIREFWWSILLHPIRVYTWVRIWIERYILKKGMPKDGWERIESTK